MQREGDNERGKPSSAEKQAGHRVGSVQQQLRSMWQECISQPGRRRCTACQTRVAWSRHRRPSCAWLHKQRTGFVSATKPTGTAHAIQWGEGQSDREQRHSTGERHVLPAAGLAIRVGLKVHSSYSRASGSLHAFTINHITQAGVRRRPHRDRLGKNTRL